MANKIESAIKKLLSKNANAAGRAKKKKVVEAVADTTMSEESALEKEFARRQKFAAKPLPNVLKEKKRKKVR